MSISRIRLLFFPVNDPKFPLDHQWDLEGEEYGLTISYPRWVLPVLASMPELRLSKFHEGLWWASQDTYVCMKEP